MKLNSKNAAFSIGILIATLLVLIALSQSRLGNGNSASPLQSTVAGKGTTEIPPKQESSENEQPLTSGAMDKGSEVNDSLGVQ